MRWIEVAVLLAALSLVVLLGFGLGRDAETLPSPLVGGAAPGFELPRLSGGDTLHLADLEGRPVVMNFWASWCLACIEEHPALARAWRRYGGRAAFLGVIYQDTPSNARRYLERYGGGWTQLLDPGTRTAIDYGVYGVPETFFIDPGGIVSHKHVGPVTDAVLAREIEALLAPTPPPPESSGDGLPGEAPPIEPSPESSGASSSGGGRGTGT